LDKSTRIDYINYEIKKLLKIWMDDPQALP